ncbi:hypothetical protein JTB14_012890 [Gonioctena quinquepunctata]|nr:hypothetical protein JTB14_012890 [Gonioctena quinquepunctata]
MVRRVSLFEDRRYPPFYLKPKRRGQAGLLRLPIQRCSTITGMMKCALPRLNGSRWASARINENGSEGSLMNYFGSPK